ncbi:MltR family transcriptional regulator [Agarivorans sp. MS3-6]|uniref:MltR family transcriptional regulator n=1 Tax=Agarivorans sp. TSD2052 TaxID=2937286 RepID=UPI00200E38D2|nr:MltR family transcriptional regulator [Agarivorans sp. TSD2052]UPW18659.1 MltR family transcriptional regulator [Agarivorans sp. TSD2052]
MSQSSATQVALCYYRDPMPIHTANEAELLEAIADATSASECLMAAYDALDDTIDTLLKSIFNKDDYAVKFAVDPLLKSDGPLGDIMLRSKLMLGLGVISQQIYQDIEIFVTLREWTKIQDEKVSFTEIDILFELNKVHAIQRIMPVDEDMESLNKLTGPMYDMYLARHNQKVRSTIVLAITDIVSALCKDNVLMQTMMR